LASATQPTHQSGSHKRFFNRFEPLMSLLNHCQNIACNPITTANRPPRDNDKRLLAEANPQPEFAISTQPITNQWLDHHSLTPTRLGWF
jgi:hypothetical protein